MNTFVIFAIIALIAGSLIPVQAATNAALSQHIDNVLFSSLILFTVAVLFIASITVISGAKVPSIDALSTAPKYGYIGGLIVGFYVLSITFLAPRMGVANAICFIVTGQILAAVTIDHFGLFNSIQTSISKERVLGVLLMIVGLFLAKK